MAQQMASGVPLSTDTQLTALHAENAQLRASLRAVRDALAELQAAWRERAALTDEAVAHDRLTYAQDTHDQRWLAGDQPASRR
jgi:hypothetical protein